MFEHIDISPSVALGIMTPIFSSSIWFNYCSSTGRWPFTKAVAHRDSPYKVDIQPTDGTFGIWGIIYLWTLSWIGYAVYSTLTGHVGWCPKEVCLAFSLLTFINVSWGLVWEREKLFWSAVILALMPLTTWYATFQAYKNFQTKGFADDLAKQLNVILLINGIACYATWSSVATIVANTVNAVYNWKINNYFVCHVAVAVLGAVMLVYQHYTTVVNPGFATLVVSPYFVFFWSSWGVWAKHGYKLNNSLTVLIFGVFAISIWLIFYRFRASIPLPLKL